MSLLDRATYPRPRHFVFFGTHLNEENGDSLIVVVVILTRSVHRLGTGTPVPCSGGDAVAGQTSQAPCRTPALHATDGVAAADSGCRELNGSQVRSW